MCRTRGGPLLSLSTAEVSPRRTGAGAPHAPLPLPLARAEPSLPTRRDTAFAASYPATGRHTMCSMILIRALVCPFPRGLTGNHRL